MTFEDIINKKKKDWGANIMDGAHAPRGNKIPLSSPLVNHSLYGGIPRGKITECYGNPGSGKSTTCIDVCKNAKIQFLDEFNKKVEALRDKASSGDKQAKIDLEDTIDLGPKKVFYLDLEHSFDDEWSTTLGISADDIEIMQPPDVCGEDILNMILEMIETGEVGLIVLDSVPSLIPKAELDKQLGERTVASLAGLLTVFCRKVIPLLTRYDCTLLVINQIRDNMDNPYVVNTPGGKALKFYACLRIEFRQGNPVDMFGNELPMNTEDPAGYIIKTKITKQKSAPYNRKNASYFLMCTRGIVPMFDYAQLAIKRYGIIKKSGGWFTMCNPSTGEILEHPDGRPIKINGLAKVYQYLEDNPDYYESLKKFITDDISGVEDTPSL